MFVDVYFIYALHIGEPLSNLTSEELPLSFCTQSCWELTKLIKKSFTCFIFFSFSPLNMRITLSDYAIVHCTLYFNVLELQSGQES